MAADWRDLPRLPGFTGRDAYASLPGYAAALHALAGVSTPPFDPRRLAEGIGIGVLSVATYEGNRGLLLPLPDGSYRIVVHDGEAPAAQRFTIAHELVELGLQVGCPTLVERSHHDAGAGRAKERYCEVGAAEILMPLARVRQAALATGGIEALLELAQLFGASLHAMLRRLVDASPTPCAGLIATTARRYRPADRLHGATWPRADDASRGTAAPAAVPVLRVSTACGGGGLVAPVPAGTPLPHGSLLAACHSERRLVRGVERFALGRLQGRFRVEAICPGYGPSRHVYALLHPL